MNKPLRFLLLLAFPGIISCATNKPFYNEKLGNWNQEVSPSASSTLYSVFLIGDSRRAFENEPVLKMMETHLSNAGENSAVVFLGDNAQPSGYLMIQPTGIGRQLKKALSPSWIY